MSERRWNHKWRDHCATCGARFQGMQLYAYCNKECERSRDGQEPTEPVPLDVVDRYLALCEQLESMPRHHPDRVGIEEEVARMKQLQDAPAPAAVRETFSSGNLNMEVAESWVAPLRAVADRFEMTLRKSLVAGIALGDRLAEAKARLAHGEFGRLFRDHENPVSDPLPFSRFWATRLMRIANVELLRKKQTAERLPPDINTVYMLARLDEQELAAKIETGEVHPRMTRQDVRLLLPAPDAKDANCETEPEDDRLADFLAAVHERLSMFATDDPSLFVEAKARVKALLRRLTVVSSGEGEA